MGSSCLVDADPTGVLPMAKPTKTEAKQHAGKVVRRLAEHYPDAQCALKFHTPVQLLVATILSAQCTDERVNMVTSELFGKYRSAADYARVSQEELEQDIKSTGFFRNKAKAIRECCRRLVEEHSGQVPADMEVLVGLPGIGRKTANVILGTAFGIASGIVVDTHVARVSRRLGLTRNKDPLRIERDLTALVPRAQWIAFSHRVIHHGRRICSARKPRCNACPLQDLCPKVGV